jgi:ribosome hibernation promoting factor
MNLHLTGHHLEITPAIREHISAKLQRITRHFDHVIDLHAILERERTSQFKVEASVHVRGKEIFCESTAPDLHAAIDALAEKLDRTIIKHKEKSLEHRHTGTPLKHRAGG